MLIGTSAGLHGVGIKATNALSSESEVEVRRDGKIYKQKYAMGRATTAVEIVGKTSKDDTGTTIKFLRDTTIFKEDNSYKWDILLTRFREMAFMTKGITFYCKDERTDTELTFCFDGGISAFVRYLNRNKKPCIR